MDVISREAVANYVDNMQSELTEDGRRMIRQIRVKEFIADCSSAFEGMTNGEVIQALFPQIELVEIYNGRHRFFLKGKESSAFDLKAEVKWLNTPYQKGGE